MRKKSPGHSSRSILRVLRVLCGWDNQTEESRWVGYTHHGLLSAFISGLQTGRGWAGIGGWWEEEAE